MLKNSNIFKKDVVSVHSASKKKDKEILNHLLEIKLNIFSIHLNIIILL